MTLSRYVLLARIGSGGAGVGYAAYDPEPDRKGGIQLVAPAPRGAAPSEAPARPLPAAQRLAPDTAPPRPGDVGNYSDFWMEPGTRIVGSWQTSLVVDPPDGRVPLKREAEQRRDDYLKQEADSFDFMSPWDRCITRGIPGGFFPAGYNNAYQIVQTPGYVVIHYEMIHAARVIPTNGRPHLPAHIRLWDGDSVGRWEGNTLVVDIANYNGKGWTATNAASGPPT